MSKNRQTPTEKKITPHSSSVHNEEPKPEDAVWATTETTAETRLVSPSRWMRKKKKKTTKDYLKTQTRKLLHSRVDYSYYHCDGVWCISGLSERVAMKVRTRTDGRVITMEGGGTALTRGIRKRYNGTIRSGWVGFLGARKGKDEAEEEHREVNRAVQVTMVL